MIWKQLGDEGYIFVSYFYSFIYLLLLIIWGFPKTVVSGTPELLVFLLKNDHFGVFWGYHHFRKHPYMIAVMSSFCLVLCFKTWIRSLRARFATKKPRWFCPGSCKTFKHANMQTSPFPTRTFPRKQVLVVNSRGNPNLIQSNSSCWMMTIYSGKHI